MTTTRARDWWISGARTLKSCTPGWKPKASVGKRWRLNSSGFESWRRGAGSQKPHVWCLIPLAVTCTGNARLKWRQGLPTCSTRPGTTCGIRWPCQLLLFPPQDAANRKSNQQNLGTIHCSNLCTEIIEYTSPDEEPLLEVGDVADVGFQPFNKLPLEFPPDHSQQDSCPRITQIRSGGCEVSRCSITTSASFQVAVCNLASLVSWWTGQLKDPHPWGEGNDERSYPTRSYSDPIYHISFPFFGRWTKRSKRWFVFFLFFWVL